MAASRTWEVASPSFPDVVWLCRAACMPSTIRCSPYSKVPPPLGDPTSCMAASRCGTGCGLLQLLVTAGLTPVQALRAATATPARRFGLTDRGRITPGARADLLLVDGDPTTTTIADTLSIRAVWRRGARQTPA